MKSHQSVFCTFFMFVNSGSGGGLGKRIEEQQIEKIQFEIDLNFIQGSEEKNKNKKQIDIYFFSMKTKRQKGFSILKNISDENKKTIVVICGGDGSVMWIVSEMARYHIQFSKVPITIIPLGTGNDFSQEIGWGKTKTQLMENSYCSLKKLIRKWLKAKQQDFDIWDVFAQTYDNGKFQKISNQQNHIIQGKSLSRSFCNYFSFGIDGKVGYSFDLHRSTSRIGNIAMYGLLGTVKAATKTKTIDELVQNMEINEELMNEKLMKGSKSLTQSKLIFQSKAKQNSKSSQKKLMIKDGYSNLVALNIDSYMGGVHDIWSKAQQGFENQKFEKSSTKDGKLQFVSFTSSMGLAMQKMIGGFAEKITQGGGPYVINFKKYDNEPKHRTYLQIDGEYIRFTHPKRILICKSQLSLNGKIKVLKNVEPKEQ